MTAWKLDMGATVLGGGLVRFRVWAPVARSVEVELYPWPGGIERCSMHSEEGGVWSATLEAPPGIFYRYRLDGHWGYPDPASRSQPEGVHGPSQVVDPRAFTWSDAAWRGPDRESLVFYEVHVGTYTPEGTFDAVAEELDALRELGVTALELMPVAEFPGRWSWGYDGAHLFAPSSIYGGPEALRRLVDAAHARGIAVVLDVVYNHRSADGNYLPAYSPDYYTERYETPWGHAVNFDGANSDRVRRYYLDNALYWLLEFHIDGLRLDATHEMHDASAKHILNELSDAVRAASGDRAVLLIAEDDRRDPRLIRSTSAGGYGLDALWVDDLHHTASVMITGDREQFRNSYQGTAEELARLINDGALYSTAGDDRPASLTSVDPWRLINCIENHDQVGHEREGVRVWQKFGLEAGKAAYALLLFIPGTPLLFMGDEFAATTPFLYFADLRESLAAEAAVGRASHLEHIGRSGASRGEAADQGAFMRSKLDRREGSSAPHEGVRRLFEELLRLRRDDAVLRLQRRDLLRAWPVGEKAVAAERWNEQGERRLLAVNFGEAVDVVAVEGEWRLLLSTAEQRFGGPGVDRRARDGASPRAPARSATLWAAGG